MEKQMQNKTLVCGVLVVGLVYHAYFVGNLPCLRRFHWTNDISISIERKDGRVYHHKHISLVLKIRTIASMISPAVYCDLSLIWQLPDDFIDIAKH